MFASNLHKYIFTDRQYAFLTTLRRYAVTINIYRNELQHCCLSSSHNVLGRENNIHLNGIVLKETADEVRAEQLIRGVLLQTAVNSVTHAHTWCYVRSSARCLLRARDIQYFLASYSTETKQRTCEMKIV